VTRDDYIASIKANNPRLFEAIRITLAPASLVQQIERAYDAGHSAGHTAGHKFAEDLRKLGGQRGADIFTDMFGRH